MVFKGCGSIVGVMLERALHWFFFISFGLILFHNIVSTRCW